MKSKLQQFIYFDWKNDRLKINLMAATDSTVVTPWSVTSEDGIDYMKLIRKFGCDPIDGRLIKKFEEVTGVEAHPWLRRGLFFSCKDLDQVLDEYAAGKQIYLYTGRGPSSESMHLGHMVPFLFTKYLQDALNAILVIQMSDDEKFAFKGSDERKPLEHFNRLSYENAKDIIACGFDPERTFIFSNLKTTGGELYANSVRIMSSVTGHAIRTIYGLDLTRKIGELAWPSFQCAPAFSNSFSDILHADGPFSPEAPDGTKSYTGPLIRCLVPMAIDQRPYFAMARDYAKAAGVPKPAEIHSEFLPALAGIAAKMSSSTGGPVVFLTDSEKEITKKIMKGAFSGGKESLELHRRYGGDLRHDVSYQYLLYFMDDDETLKDIAHRYRSGEMLSGEIKKIMADQVCKFVKAHQEKRAAVDDKVLRHFFNRNRKFNMERTERPALVTKSDETYQQMGINFDRTFGAPVPDGAAEFEARQLAKLLEPEPQSEPGLGPELSMSA